MLFHIFLWPRISNFPRLRWCSYPTGQLPFVYSPIRRRPSVCVCVKRKFYRISFASFFYVFSCRCKISTYVQNYMYEHIKSHFLKDMKTPLSRERRGDKRKEEDVGATLHIHTQVQSSFLLLLLLASSLPSIRERKTCVDI